MAEVDIGSKCKVNSNDEMDAFVGLRCDNGDLSIHFPMGYHISDDKQELRNDIMLLLKTLAMNTKWKQSELLGKQNRFHDVEFPLQSYLYIIKDFFARGYYREQEIVYKTARTGKINWNRTIKTQKPYVQDNEVYYLDFVTRKNAIKENELITLIHEYCVYESFERLGWLFTKTMPDKPRVRKREKVFRAVLKEKISSTFNDRNKMLFRHMLAIIDFQGDKDADKNYRYGTCRFEYVWEEMIDKVFGIPNKSDYFPKTYWSVNGVQCSIGALKPDTIMVYDNNVYILDAKYYKTGNLPGAESIGKQIIYGEYVSYEPKFKETHGNDMKVFNAFLMPFDFGECRDTDYLEMSKTGEAVSSWKDNKETYQRIQGIYMDVKGLMRINVRQETKEIKRLAELIKS